MNRIIVHIPHSNSVIPEEYLPNFTIAPSEISSELLRMTDHYTDELFDWPDRLVFPISRLVCDVERFRDKQKESMSQQGMWVCYTHTSEEKEMKYINADHEKEILDKYYDPHHKLLAKLAEDRIRVFGHCVIVDVHSFSPKPLLYEPNQDNNRPQICIGTDDYHTSDDLKYFTRQFFSDCGYSTDLNNPYSGAITPMGMYKREPRLIAIMIELNRSLYMDIETAGKTKGFMKLKTYLREYLVAINEYYDSE